MTYLLVSSKRNLFLISIFVIALIARTLGNTEHSIAPNEEEESLTTTANRESVNDSNSRVKCGKETLDIIDVRFLKNNKLLIKAFNATVHLSNLNIAENTTSICFVPTQKLKNKIFSICEKMTYDKDEFRKLSNGSIWLYGYLLEPEVFEINQNGKLVICAPVDDYENDGSSHPDTHSDLVPDGKTASSYIGKIGSSISILALSANLVTFWLVPSLRNLPGYNLISLSVAYIMAYFFLLIGQIPKVLGLFCVISGVLQQYFFLAAFFFMNAMSFDVWNTLKMATERLALSTKSSRRRQFLYYSIYAWLVPLSISITSVVVDNADYVPENIKPQFGKNDTCWIMNQLARGIFFAIPAFILFAINVVFFVLSALILKRNTMKETNNQQKERSKMNYVLYIRLALMMGLTWMASVVAAIFNKPILWYFFDILNSLQGLFVFLLCACSRKVFVHMRNQIYDRSSKNSSMKNSTESSKCERKDSVI